MTIYTFYKRDRQFSQVMSSNRNLNRNRYFRLMALAAIEVLCTIPISSYVLSITAKHVAPWKSWAQTHNNGHYSRIMEIPASVWKDIPDTAHALEMFRWLLVTCAFIFFAFFGFADEARKHYRLVFVSLAGRLGYSTSSVTTRDSSHAYVIHCACLTTRAHHPFSTSSFRHMKNKGGVTVSVVTASGDKRDSMASFADRLSIPSISYASDLKPDFKVEEYSPSDSIASSSVDTFEPETRGPPSHPVTILPAVPPASVPPHLLDSTKTTIRAYSSEAADTV
jgi:pheromone a factor receptor